MNTNSQSSATSIGNNVCHDVKNASNQSTKENRSHMSVKSMDKL